eukprot:259460_1
MSFKIVYRDYFPNEYLLCGYIRMMQKLFPSDVVFYIIPPIVHSICVNYYYDPEQFTMIGACIRDLGNNKVFMQGSGYNTVYGNISIRKDLPFIYIWTFKIPQNNMFGDYNHLCLGIDSSNRKYGFCNFSDRSRNKYNFYSYSSDGTKISHCTAEQPYGGRDFTCGNNCRIGYSDATNIFDAEIKMEINIPQKILKFYHKISWRFVDAGIAFSNIDFDTDNTYHLAISLKKGTGIELIDFKKNEVH